jgi:hypothetical protein
MRCQCHYAISGYHSNELTSVSIFINVVYVVGHGRVSSVCFNILYLFCGL